MTRASAPASCANLGPGFDCLALAIDLRCSVTATPAPEWSVTLNGAVLGLEESALVMAAAGRGASTDAAFRLEIDSPIPIGRGLGSSAAVAAATFLASARAMGGDPTPYDTLVAVGDLEDHPDNAAATVFGGLVAIAEGAVTRLGFAESLHILVAVPDVELLTTQARRGLPTTVPHAAAARNVARVVFLVEGLRRGDPELLRRARGDELHEPYRAELAPITAELVEAALAEGAWHAARSGAGPAAVALGPTEVLSAVERSWSGLGVQVLRPRLSQRGAE